jgi:hydrogenase large subunit
VPDYQPDTDRYTWAKAPRYGEQVVETGPLADLLTGGDALIRSLLAREGPNAWLRQFARLRRTGLTLHFMKPTWPSSAASSARPTSCRPRRRLRARRRLRLRAGRPRHPRPLAAGHRRAHQPLPDRHPDRLERLARDSAGRHGHWEQSVIGLELADPADPVEIGHIVRSHDPCLVCTVHFVQRGTPTPWRC